jgi:surface polysaccharide O-acyltransferase-like enzyme
LLQVQQFPQRIRGLLMVLGQSSLFVYVVHLVVVYGSVANLGLADILGQNLSVPAAAAVALGVLLSMTVLASGFRYLRGTHRVHLRVAQAGVATLLMYLFVTRPY